MSKIVKKWRKVVGSNKNHRESLIEHDFLAPTTDEFIFKCRQKCTDENVENINININSPYPIYNEYDNLEHVNQPGKAATVKKRNELKDATNTSHAKGLKRFFHSKSTEKSSPGNDFSKPTNTLIECDKHVNEDKFDQNRESFYCEIQDFSSLFSDNQPLIELNNDELKSRFTDSKVNLFIKPESDEQAQALRGYEPGQERAEDKEEEANEDQEKITPDLKQDLTTVRSVDSFESRADAIQWFLTVLTERMSACVRAERSLSPAEQLKRVSVLNAHLLYSRSYYEMRTTNATATALRSNKIAEIHPCVIALACLLDSDAVRVVEAHSCACDSYLCMFATRVKFCAWKTKLFVILKRPKRSSIERLNLIEDLINCRKLMNN